MQDYLEGLLSLMAMMAEECALDEPHHAMSEQEMLRRESVDEINSLELAEFQPIAEPNRINTKLLSKVLHEGKYDKCFILAWIETENFKKWLGSFTRQIAFLHPGHPPGHVYLLGENGDYFKGDLACGVKAGQGTHYQNGFTYTGGFKEDKRHGEGSLTKGESYLYEGGWVSGDKSGYGMEISRQGKYTGEWVKGQR